MASEVAKKFRHHVVAGARDIVVISTVVTLIFGLFAALTKPYWEPFARLPENMVLLQTELAEARSLLEGSIEPRIVDFQGRGIVVSVSPITAGGTVQILYSLRRNATCATEVTPIFYNVDRGISIQGEVVPAIRAPVTATFQPFSVPIQIPEWLTAGRYIYYPEITPLDCGVYNRIRVPPSDIIVVE